MGSCSLDCDTAFWEVVLGKKPEGIRVGIKRCTKQSTIQLSGQLDGKGEGESPSWCLEGHSFKEGDVIGVCWDQTDLPMLSFTLNGAILPTGSITRIRPANDIYPAVSLTKESTCEIIFDGAHFLKSAPSSKFSMIVCATSLI